MPFEGKRVLIERPEPIHHEIIREISGVSPWYNFRSSATAFFLGAKEEANDISGNAPETASHE
jgi:hypothetical protein